MEQVTARFLVIIIIIIAVFAFGVLAQTLTLDRVCGAVFEILD
jgi:hypothetical protein